jgi:hypothetical protein
MALEVINCLDIKDADLNELLTTDPFDFKLCALHTDVRTFKEKIYLTIEELFFQRYYVMAAIAGNRSHFVTLIRQPADTFKVFDDVRPTNLQDFSNYTERYIVKCVILVRHNKSIWAELPRNDRNCCLISSYTQLCLQLPHTFWIYFENIHKNPEDVPFLSYMYDVQRTGSATNEKMIEIKELLRNVESVKSMKNHEINSYFPEEIDLTQQFYKELESFPCMKYSLIVNNGREGHDPAWMVDPSQINKLKK